MKKKTCLGNTKGDNKQLAKKTCSHSTSRGTHAIADGGQILSFGYPFDPLTSRAPVFLTVHVVVVQAVTACRWEEQVGAESIALGARRHKVLPGRASACPSPTDRACVSASSWSPADPLKMLGDNSLFQLTTYSLPSRCATASLSDCTVA